MLYFTRNIYIRLGITVLSVVACCIPLTTQANYIDLPQTKIHTLLASATQISTGRGHSCAITIEGGVKCWGSNTDLSQSGPFNHSEEPFQVPGLTTGVAKIFTGTDNGSCAIIHTGQLKCWGGYMFERLPQNADFIGTGIQSVVFGEKHGCALSNIGGVKCWGRSDKVGSDQAEVYETLTPIDVTGLTNGVRAIAASWDHSCAILTSGGLKCWGKNNGRIGDGLIKDRQTPVDVIGLDSAVKAVATGREHTCAVTITNTIMCWGANSLGSAYHYSPTPTKINGIDDDILSIVAGSYHTCVLTATKNMKCWGSNDDGELGNQSHKESDTPVLVQAFTNNINMISAGEGFSCAVTNTGNVKCWGYNGFGRLGDGTFDNRLAPVNVVGFNGSNQPISTPTSSVLTPTSRPSPTSIPQATPTPQAISSNNWLFMFYLAGDNELDMDRALRRALENLETWAKEASANPNLTIVVMYDGRERNDTLRIVYKPEIGIVKRDNLPEANMADPNTLRDFMQWAYQNYPAGQTYLNIVDHARATTGIAFDTNGKGDWSNLNTDRLTTVELRQALLQVTNNGEIKLNILHFDACLMGLVEVAYDLSDVTQYMIASESQTLTVFPFDQYALRVPAQDKITARELARQIAEVYIKHPTLVGGNYVRAISVLDLSKIQSINSAINNLAEALIGSINQYRTQIATAAISAQKFDSHTTPLNHGKYGTIDKNDAFFDLFDLADQLAQSVTHSATRDTAQHLKEAINNSGFIIFNQANSGVYKEGERQDIEKAKGVAIFFPPTGNYLEYRSYIEDKSFKFTQHNKWNEFLDKYMLGYGLGENDDEDNSSVPSAFTTDKRVYMALIAQ